MQVFLPLPSFADTAKALDNSRLGNQCYRECLTLYNGGWPHHPAAKMWKDYPNELARYAFALAKEMTLRGFKCGPKWEKFWKNEMRKTVKKTQGLYPPFVGDAEFHASHRSNLLRKGVEDATFLLFKNDPRFPSKKSLWKPETYEAAWDANGGKPASKWYSKFGWSEPDNLPYVWPLDA